MAIGATTTTQTTTIASKLANATAPAADIKAKSAPERSPQIDPALLARISIEEELKRRGGGGGGGGRTESFNPNLFVSYSYKIINDALRELFELGKTVFNSGTAILEAPANLAANITKSINNAFSGVMTNIGNFGSNLMATILSPFNSAKNLATNFASLGTLIGSAIANGLKKIFYGKDEEKIETKEYEEDKEGFFGGLINFMTLSGNADNESNGKTIKAHIDNVNKQILNWNNVLIKPFKDLLGQR